MQARITRRQALAGLGVAAASSVAAPAGAAETPRRRGEPFRYCLNTGTMMGFKLPITELVDLAAKAGYDAIEPWVSELEAYSRSGGSLPDLAARVRDHGMTVESSIAFFEWVVEDDARRTRGLEAAKKAMDLVRRIGGQRIAAPPAGATDQANLDLLKAAERYRALLELGDRMEVVPELEIWGFSQCLNRLGAGAFVAVESGHPKACVLADVCHLYRGGSELAGLRKLNGAALPIFHVNDYPAGVPRERMTDDKRLYPGDGAAPLAELYRDLKAIGFQGALSLELFNSSYWKQPPLTVATTGLRKMRESVRAGLSG